MSVEETSQNQEQEAPPIEMEEIVPFSIAFTNPYAAQYYRMTPIRRFFDQRLGKGRWECYPNEIFHVPHTFERHATENVEPNFFNGFSMAQYMIARKTGKININPILSGLFYDPDNWLQFLSGEKNKEIVFYFETPYELYVQSNPGPPITREEYAETEEKLLELVNRILDKNYAGVH